MPERYLCMSDDPFFAEKTALTAAPVSFLETIRKNVHDPVEWLALMAEHAFSDLVESSEYRDVYDGETGLFVSLPPQLSNLGTGMENAFVIPFHNRIEKDLFHLESYCFEGHTGVFSLMEQARDALLAGEIRNAIVGGVESSLFPQWLSELDRDYKIKSDRNIDGYIPGETAAFVWLTQKSHQTRREDADVFEVDRLNINRGNDLTTSPASALTEVISELLHDSDSNYLFFCDLNGQSHRMDEWGYVRTRLGEQLGNSVQLYHPADSLGDIGAASGAALIILAAYHLKNKISSPNQALIWTASERGERAAMRLTFRDNRDDT